MNKIPVILIIMDKDAVNQTFGLLNLSIVEIKCVLMEAEDNGTIGFGEFRVPLLTFKSIGKVLSDPFNKSQCLWLLAGGSQGQHSVWGMAKILIENGVVRENIIHFAMMVTGQWLGNLRYIEKHPVDFFATGISSTEDALDLTRFKDARGVILANDSQDLLQGYLTARHVFEHQKSIKFALIGLVPYSFRYDNRKSFSVCPKNVQYMLALKDPRLETPHDKILARLLENVLNRIYTLTTDAHSDLNYVHHKRDIDKGILPSNLVDWKKHLDGTVKDFREETVAANLKLFEDYIKLCLDNGAKPVAVLWPYAPIVRRHYPPERIFYLRYILRQFEKAYDFTFIDLFDLPLDYEYFHDVLHINLKGAALVSTVLNIRLHERNVLPFEQITHTTLAELRSLADVLDKTEYNALLEKIFAASAALIRQKDRIKIGFVLFDAAMWCGDELYNLFARNERYETTVFIDLRRDNANDPNVIKDFRHGVEQLRSRGINVFAVIDINMQLPEQDVLILLTPYQGFLPNAFLFERLTARTLTAYIPYSIHSSPLFNINEPIMFVGWKIFFDRAVILKDHDQKCAMGMPRGLHSGHPKLDALVSNQTPIYHWKEAQPNPTRIIWAPHWAIDDGVRFATFQWNYQFMLDYAREHPEISWVVKPHPNLLFSAVKEKVFPSTEAFEAYLAQWDALPNAKVETGAYYHNIFASSDGMILDSGSFILEYQYTHKPMLFLTRDTQQFGETASELMQVTYRVDGKDHAGIANFIEKVLIGKNDPNGGGNSMVIGYTTGVYDLFHIGHLNLLKNARGLCDKLIVGVTIDKLVEYKKKRSVIPFEERIEIVRNIKWVDAAIPQETLDKFEAWEKLKFDVLFVGDDWYQTPSWEAMEAKFKEVGVRVVYFPYTKGISSTIISNALRTLRSDDFASRIGGVDVDRDFCMSSYLMYRYVVDPKKSFSRDKTPWRPDLSFPRVPIKTSDELISALKSKVEAATADGKAALALSGGIDSAILAKFMPEGSTAYTFRCVVPGKQVEDESLKARPIAEANRLNHKIIDITFDDQMQNADVLMKDRGAPIHSIESQIYQAAKQAKADGFTKFIFGEIADTVYGGLDGLLSKHWSIGEFIERYSYVLPYKVLRRPMMLTEPFLDIAVDGVIDPHAFLNKYFLPESLGSYSHACGLAGIEFVAPYSETFLAAPLDWNRIRNGQSKYVVRDAFAKLYPEREAPKKTPMPRPMNEWMSSYAGPTREEFIPHCIDGMKGDQKWMVYCLERFLNLLEESSL